MTETLPLAGMLTCLGILILIVSFTTPAQPAARKVLCLLAAAAAVAYITWRLGQVPDLPCDLSFRTAWMWAFLGAEMTCIANFLFSTLTWSRTTDRRREADTGEAALRRLSSEDHPAVDLWIATYNEDWEILERTLTGCLALDWPAERLKVWVLDDGRRDGLRERCAELGVGYVTRPDNRGRKAGNHNHALAATNAPFILSLDADFVPFPQILYRTLGLFVDPQVAIVQTPQVFYNVEPTRKNLGLHKVMPGTYDGFFYQLIQPARDAWCAAFYCGTSAVLRRAAFEAIGGFETRTTSRTRRPRSSCSAAAGACTTSMRP